jgi:hypothetical protein
MRFPVPFGTPLSEKGECGEPVSWFSSWWRFPVFSCLGFEWGGFYRTGAGAYEGKPATSAGRMLDMSRPEKSGVFTCLDIIDFFQIFL